MSYSFARFRKNAYSARLASGWRRNLCALTGCLALSSSAWAIQVDLGDLNLEQAKLAVGEGQSLRLNLRASSLNEFAAETQCVVTGRVIPKVSSANSAVLGQDYTLVGQEFSITFITKNVGEGGTVGEGSTSFEIKALNDKIIDPNEAFQLSAERVVANCSGPNFYGGVIDPNVPFQSYGPLVGITDTGVNLEQEKLALLPELESLTVLTMSGAQARNKTLAKQMDFARQKPGQSSRVSMTLDGVGIPVEGANAGDTFSPWGFFVAGDFERGDRDLKSTNNFDFTTNTLMAGIDYRLSDHWILGGSVSGSEAKAEQNARPDETKLSQTALRAPPKIIVFLRHPMSNFFLC